ncbi:3 beta-hydroxysteroid dehydrogenase/Delta 5--_4-isomerase [subsurface metagenome]
MILVTGGSGFVGSHLIPRMVESGHRIRCLVPRPAEGLRGRGVEVVMGDVTDPESLKTAMSGVEAVVHLVGILRESRGASFSGVNVQGTRNVLQAAQDSGVKRFIHIGVLGASPDPRYGYLYSKWLGEEAVRSSQLDFTILRPAAMFGAGAGFINRLAGSLKMFPLLAPIAGPGKSRFQPIWVEDVVTCILKALQGGKIGQSCEIGGPEHLTYEQMLDTVMQALGKRWLKIHVPLVLMRPAVMVMEKLVGDLPVTLGELDQLELDSITDLDSVERQFGFRPLPLSQGLDYLRPA